MEKGYLQMLVHVCKGFEHLRSPIISAESWKQCPTCTEGGHCTNTWLIISVSMWEHSEYREKSHQKLRELRWWATLLSLNLNPGRQIKETWRGREWAPLSPGTEHRVGQSSKRPSSHWCKLSYLTVSCHHPSHIQTICLGKLQDLQEAVQSQDASLPMRKNLT